MSEAPIDVWSEVTFDHQLAERLADHARLIVDYFTESRRLWEERETQTLRGPMLSNKFGAAYYALLDELTPALDTRTIRGWHHTRMTDDEVAIVIATGIRPATLADVGDRLDRRVAAGDLSRAEADTLFAASPFLGERAEARVGRFWLTTHPQEVDDSGVEPLLGRWGGESINFSHFKGSTADLLASIGHGRVIEVAVPLAVTPDAFSAAKAVVATYARTRGAPADFAGFDFYSTAPLPAAAALHFHTEGEHDYERLGRTYPVNFRDYFGG